MVFRPNKHVNNNINDINLAGKVIQKSRTAKFLGIWVDDELEWDKHIDYISKKIASGSYVINATKRILTSNNLKLLYFSLVHSHLSYGTLIWGSAVKYRIRKLEIKQKQCLRNICNAKYNIDTTSLFKKQSILKLNDIINMQLGKLMYMSIHKLAPPPVCSIFTLNTELHTHNTRRRHDPHIETRSSNIISRTFKHKAPK